MLLRSLMAGVKSSDRVRCPHCQSIETAQFSQTSPAYVCLGCGKPFEKQPFTKDDNVVMGRGAITRSV